MSTPSSRGQGVLETVVGDSAGDRLGEAVAPAGDINADGADDLIVGAPFDDNNGADSGNVRVVSGFTGAILFSFDGDSSGDRFGTAVDNAGDVNGDGFLDLIVGAPFDDNTGTDTGSVRIISGATGLTIFALDGSASVVEFGRCVSGAGDMNLDGFDDFVVGQSLASGIPGPLAQIFSGLPGGFVVGLFAAISGAAEAVDGGADFGGNGSNDVIVGNDQDVVQLFNFAGNVVFSATGDTAGDRFGASVSFVPDVDGDSVSDFVVGAPNDDNAGVDSGSARVFSGLAGAILYTADGTAAGDHFGTSVSATIDVDGNTTGDVLVGAPGFDLGLTADAGEVEVLQGPTGLLLYSVVGIAAGDEFGTSVTGLNHVNGDFKGDFAAGAPGDDSNGVDAGRATIYTGTCAVITSYGTGCAPLGLPTPTFDFTGCLAYGATTTFEYMNGVPNAPAFLFIGVTQGAFPLPGGCTFLLGAFLPTPLVFLASSTGGASVPIVVPDFPVTPYLPSKVYSQVLQMTAGGQLVATDARCKCIG